MNDDYFEFTIPPSIFSNIDLKKIEVLNFDFCVLKL